MQPIRTFLLFLSLSSFWAMAQTNGFQITGTVKTKSKEDGDAQQRFRREVSFDEKTKVLEMKFRRTNPTVGEQVTVNWGVWIKDMKGRVRLITQGERDIMTTVGVMVELTSDPFSLVEKNVDMNSGRTHDKEQDVEGYAVWMTDPAGQVVGYKFQPSRMKEEVLKLMAEDQAKQEKRENREQQMEKQRKERRQRKALMN